MKIAIYGASGFGREVAWLIADCIKADSSYELLGFIDDDPLKRERLVNGIPVLNLEEAGNKASNIAIVSGIGNPRVRETTMDRARTAGFFFHTILHPRIEKSDYINIGEGTVICAGCILTTNIRIGRQVQINLDCTVGHDVVVGDYTTLAPGVHVSGWVNFGKRVYVGTGAVIINGTEKRPLHIGDDAVVGAGAVVTKSVPPNATVVGVPARVISSRR